MSISAVTSLSVEQLMETLRRLEGLEENGTFFFLINPDGRRDLYVFGPTNETDYDSLFP